ncbi:MAG TPA: hypothetical protein VNB22_20510 [Pyrinomonadaceae bacterium]|jgi:hypothetical protein|nr:hypothetical protein [Pyrinomonadaceae bacterium]
MQKLFSAILGASFLMLVGCQPDTSNVNTNRVNTNVNLSNTFNGNTNSNANVSSVNSDSTISETKEPDQYQATVQLKLEATSDKNAASLPAISANVARSAADRRMEFNLPNGDKIVYLDKDGTTYVLLPNRKQYAVLDKESMGFEVRQLMMPEQIVNQVKAIKGVERVGEENVNGRTVIKYRYGAVTNTQTQAGQVQTESFLLIDKETGLPLHSETVSQSQNGNVQGYQGLRIVTEMSNIKTETTPDLFAVPSADYQKIDSAQVKSQVELIFNAVGLLLKNTLNSAQNSQNSNTNTAVPMTSPTAAK